MYNALRLWTVIALVAIACTAQRTRAATKDIDTSTADPSRNISGRYLSPTALATTPDRATLFVACATGNAVLELRLSDNSIARRFAVPNSPSGLALSTNGHRLYVTCASPTSSVYAVELPAGRVVSKISAGHTAMAPVLSLDEKTLYVCNRFNNAIGVINLVSGKEIHRIAVPREPVAAALTTDGKHLLIANHIHNGRSDGDIVAAVVTVIDLAARRVVKNIPLPNGSTLLRDVQVSPNGKYACVTHLLARFHLPTTQIERGWIQSNALTIVDLAEMKLLNTVLLDNVDRGAANPWAAAWSPDGRWIVVIHAGTHELSIIDAPALLTKLSTNTAIDSTGVSRSSIDVANDLAFLVGLRTRIKLQGKGPRAVAIVSNKVYAANYFSDSIDVADLNSELPKVHTIPLGPSTSTSQCLIDVVRRGEMLFNDATLSFQGWLSCASCHSSDARVDGLNWDLLNDGIGNPKNDKSLLLAHQTPPTTALGVRQNAHVSVRAGIKNILFTVQPEEVADALDQYLSSLRPIPSPYLIGGKPSERAIRGRRLFHDDAVGCSGCHKSNLFTSLKAYDVGTHGQHDKGTEKFDTPTLIESWRSGPYLHDGSAATVRDVMTTRNPKDRHGVTSRLTPEEIDDLAAYVLSL